MDYQRFSEHLPLLYEDWGKPSVRPRSSRFAEILAGMRSMTTANVLQLLNCGVGHLETDEVYCEVGCLQEVTLIGASSGARIERPVPPTTSRSSSWMAKTTRRSFAT
jgi:hypothetical protein